MEDGIWHHISQNLILKHQGILNNMRNIFKLLISVFLLTSCRTIMIDYEIMPDSYPNTIKDWWSEDRELFVDFTRYVGYTHTRIEADLHTKKAYKTLYVKELSCEIDGKTVVLIKNKAKKILYMEQLPDGFYYIGDETGEFNDGFWLGKLNLQRLFPWLEFDKKYDMIFRQVYTFDDEPLRTNVFNYKIFRFETDKEMPWFMYFDTP
jgi:hypothetical protein